MLPNTPQANLFVDDGVNIYAAANGPKPFWKAPLTNPTTWTQAPQVALPGQLDLLEKLASPKFTWPAYAWVSLRIAQRASPIRLCS